MTLSSTFLQKCNLRNKKSCYSSHFCHRVHALRWRGGRPQRYLPGDISTTAENSASSSSRKHSLLKRSAKSNIESRRNPAPVDVWNKSKHMRTWVLNAAFCFDTEAAGLTMIYAGHHKFFSMNILWCKRDCCERGPNLLKAGKMCPKQVELAETSKRGPNLLKACETCHKQVELAEATCWN